MGGSGLCVEVEGWGMQLSRGYRSDTGKKKEAQVWSLIVYYLIIKIYQLRRCSRRC